MTGDEWRPCSTILVSQKPSASVKVGDTGTRVWKDGKTYTLTVKQVLADQCYVAYKGWRAVHNEWVAAATFSDKPSSAPLFLAGR